MRRLRFLWNNLRHSAALPVIRKRTEGSLVFRPMPWRQIGRVQDLYEQLNGGHRLSLLLRLLLVVRGSRLCVLVQNEAGATIGFILYYFRDRDGAGTMIHEAFIGVIPECQGKGIGTQMRRVAIEHFRSSRLLGMTSTVSVDNDRSLSGALKLGFTVDEEFVESESGKRRVRLQLPFVGTDDK